MNDNQNMYVKPGRTTSRVIHPPGGPSTLTLGMAPMPAPKPKPEKKAAPTVEEAAPEVDVKAEETSPTKGESSTSPTSATEAPDVAQKKISSNAFASGANSNGAQVMTGRPSSRVIVPGGGGGPTQWSL
mmetsp:Transcript_17829/g.23077  ORF Transcript_17829/g.23077 Transcript_17829/m.23077 type:complete len:129 (-) Transcript_17829:39-425(-)|eukprot:CAMPEP_0198147026 /NCGR_PEP_ID=MMETSP1443-20131203/32964_1 /TAXON_ID=186043 /ORGANISM="Entomoneis sp., Strain CCMP2396" /LENGTH=128 /DNA_ID=CAMNT_0043811173 /DNA_START=51 /DNA_END=437 /DNA_ORIENTATION=+